MCLQYLNIITIELHNNHEQKGKGYDVDKKGYEDNTYLIEREKQVGEWR